MPLMARDTGRSQQKSGDFQKRFFCHRIQAILGLAIVSSFLFIHLMDTFKTHIEPVLLPGLVLGSWECNEIPRVYSKIILFLSFACRVLYLTTQLTYIIWRCKLSHFNSDTLQPHALKPARLLCPLGSPGKNMEWVARAFSRWSSRPRNRTWISHTAGKILYRLSHQGSPLSEDK